MVDGLAITAPRRDFERAKAHLQSRAESAAFFLAARSELGLEIVATRLLTDGDVETGSWHLELTEETRVSLLQWASGTELSLVEAHSHGKLGDPARFSPTDVRNLNDWVPHLFWRLPGRAYGALVFGFRTFDGVAWLPGRDGPVAITRIQIHGDDPWIATGRSLGDFTNTEEVPK